MVAYALADHAESIAESHAEKIRHDGVMFYHRIRTGYCMPYKPISEIRMATLGKNGYAGNDEKNLIATKVMLSVTGMRISQLKDPKARRHFRRARGRWSWWWHFGIAKCRVRKEVASNLFIFACNPSLNH